MTRYNLRSKYVLILPWKSPQDLPKESREWYNNYIKKYKPTRCDKDLLIRQLKVLYRINRDNSCIPEESVKAIMRLVAENKWFLRENPKFHKITRVKCLELIDHMGYDSYEEEFGDTLNCILNGPKRMRE